MAEKYNETMNRVELSAEARERILGNIRKWSFPSRSAAR